MPIGNLVGPYTFMHVVYVYGSLKIEENSMCNRKFEKITEGRKMDGVVDRNGKKKRVADQETDGDSTGSRAGDWAEKALYHQAGRKNMLEILAL